MDPRLGLPVGYKYYMKVGNAGLACSQEKLGVMAVKLGGWGLGLKGDRLRTSRISVIRSAVVRRERLLLVRWGSRRVCCAGASPAAGSSGCGAMVSKGKGWGVSGPLQVRIVSCAAVAWRFGSEESPGAAEVGNCAS